MPHADVISPETRPRALVVDDNALVAWCLTELLSEAGFDAKRAANGEEAIRMLERSAFDLIVTDLRLPEADGFAVASVAKARNPLAFIVMMSSFADAETLARAMHIGLDGFLEKPVEFEMLKKFTTPILRRKRTPENTAGAGGFAR